MYAIVATGGKQYKVKTGDVFEVEKLDVAPGELVALDVVFVADGSAIVTENDELASAKVFAEVVEHFKGDKQLIFKFKKRKGYKRLRGHRQGLTRLEVKGISLTGEMPKEEATPSVVEAASVAPQGKPDKAVAAKPAAARAKKPVAENPDTKPAVKNLEKVEATAEKAAPAETAAKAAASEKAATPAKAAATKTAAKAASPKKAVAPDEATEKAAADEATEKVAATEAPEKKPTRKAPAKKSAEAIEASASEASASE